MAKFLDDLIITGNNTRVLTVNSSSVSNILLASSTGNVAVGANIFSGGVYSNPKFIINTGSGIPGLMHLNSFGVELVTYTNVGDSLFGNASNHDLAFITNNVQRIKVTAAGAVGINHLTPPAQLTVVGAGNTSSTHALRVANSASTVLLNVRDDGNVGIGTTTPSFDLDVVKSVASSDVTISAQNTAASGYSVIETLSDNAVNFASIATFNTAGGVGTFYDNNAAGLSVNSPLGFLINENASGGWILTAGGYGTTSERFRVTTTQTSLSRNVVSITDGTSSFTATASLHIRGIDATSSNFSLKVQNSASTELLSIRNDGKVGVGTTTPKSKLHVFDSTQGLLVGNSTGGAFANAAAFGLDSTYSIIGFANGTDVGTVSNWLWNFGESSGAGTASFWRAGTSYATLSAQSGQDRISLKRDSGVVSFAVNGTSGVVTVETLSGVGTRVVNVNSSGELVAGVAAGSAVDGTGTTNYISKWSDSDTITDSQISDDGTDVAIASLAGTGDRMVEANTTGVVAASRTIITTFGVPNTEKIKLEEAGNWDGNGVFTGAGVSPTAVITGTFQGQMHYDDNYLYMAVGDNLFIRLIRG